MALTKRGKVAAGALAGVLVLGGVVGVLAFTGNAPAPLQRLVDTVIDRRVPCPLTGLFPRGKQDPPSRPALAVKVENAPVARPQSGLDRADIVVEEPVEGGLTRFIVVYHCNTSRRVGPIRSARTTDPRVLSQLRSPFLVYAGGVKEVEREIQRAGLVDLSCFGRARDVCYRDETREMPHNLYASAQRLYRVAPSGGASPDPLFDFDVDPPTPSRRASQVHIPFSSVSADVRWTWDERGRWLRWDGEAAHVLEDGNQIEAVNVVVMHVRVEDSSILDAAGNPSPDVDLTGRGKVWVFRDGAVIRGSWQRKGLDDRMSLVTREGDAITLAPGTTWVELVPSSVPVDVSRRST